MDVLLTHSLVDYKEVADSVEAILNAIDLNGPAVLADSTLSFLSLAVHLIASERPNRTNPAPPRVMHWLFSKWTPRK